MVLLHRRPAPPLAGHVEMLWYCQGYSVAHSRERVLPNGRFQLIIDLAGGAPPCELVIGLRSGYTVIETAGLQSLIGAVFHPGGARGFFHSASDEFYNKVVPLDDLWGGMAAGLRERLLQCSNPAAKLRLLESELQRRALSVPPLHQAVQYALNDLRRSPCIERISAIAGEARLSRRRFAQLFREQVGMTPKLFLRLNRFQQVVRQAACGAPADWADVALAGGYCDQAHMAHEFRAFSGMSPGTFLAAQRPFQNHVVLE
jgi:AraC-like DNA-binding protein